MQNQTQDKAKYQKAIIADVSKFLFVSSGCLGYMMLSSLSDAQWIHAAVAAALGTYAVILASKYDRASR